MERNFRSDWNDRSKRTTSGGGPLLPENFHLGRTAPFMFGPKFPEILVQWKAPNVLHPGVFRAVFSTAKSTPRSRRFASSLLNLTGLPFLWWGETAYFSTILLHSVRTCSSWNQAIRIRRCSLPRWAHLWIRWENAEEWIGFAVTTNKNVEAHNTDKGLPRVPRLRVSVIGPKN